MVRIPRSVVIWLFMPPCFFKTRPRAQNKRLTSNNNIRGERFIPNSRKATRVHLKTQWWVSWWPKQGGWWSGFHSFRLAVQQEGQTFFMCEQYSYSFMCLFTHSTNVYLPTTIYEPNVRHRNTMVDQKKKKRKKTAHAVLMEVFSGFGTKLSVLNVQFSLEPILSQNSHTLLWFFLSSCFASESQRWWHP